MEITSPISHIDEIEPLVAAGAKELYCGVVPSNWVAQFNTGAVNRRYFSNLPSLSELEKAVTIAHGAGAQLFLVLNAQHYGTDQLDALVNLGNSFNEMGGDAVIVADLTLIVALREQVPDLGIHVSSVASCRNSAAVSFYRDLGVRRVILPRDVTLDEIEVIAKAVPDVEIEVFILNDGCVFEEGVCHTIHLPKKLGGPICVDSYQFEYVGAAGKAMPHEAVRRLQDNDADYKRWLWYRFGCGFSTTEEGYPYGPCGLCAIHRLREAGVASIKIAGREGATERKIKSVEMVHQVLEKARQGADAMSVATTAVGIRKTVKHCQSGYMCYYPEVRYPL
ncbi:U32 family peptidase [Herminiimonas sp. CN]|uniref:U32 family peptidase n=1 Tax=Herminiimonas sp. CN TaxID=1349818 RepID=UPI00047358E8|nr:U32 family peptidase [Herminiimonas sp. CN]